MQALTARYANPRILLSLALVVGVLGMQAGRGTMAYFTSSQSSTNNTFVAGSVTLDTLGTAIDETAAEGYLAPGDTITGQLTIKNSGTIAAYYSVQLAQAHTTVAATQALEGRAKLTVKVLGTGANCTAANGPTFISAQSLTDVLGNDNGYTDGNTFVVPAGYLFGNAENHGNNSVDKNGSAGARKLAAGGSETLCFTLAMDVGSAPSDNVSNDNVFKNTTVNYTLVARAAQQANRGPTP